MLEQRIQQQFFDSADLHYAAAEVLAKPVNAAVSALIGCITAGGKVLACGNGGGKIRDQLTETDVHICVPHERTARIQEIHLLVLHCLCDAVDLQLLGEEEDT